MIKAHVSKKCAHLVDARAARGASRVKRRENDFWQRRFWEHQLRDERDYERHVDYIHYNPVKHGLVNHVAEWPYSTFHQYVKRGVYTNTWCLDPGALSAIHRMYESACAVRTLHLLVASGPSQRSLDAPRHDLTDHVPHLLLDTGRSFR